MLENAVRKIKKKINLFINVEIESLAFQAPSVPLETAEQFLLTLGSISNLEARLKLWAFKLDFKVDLLNLQTNSDFNLSGDGKRHM